MAIDFPNSGAQTWRWDGAKWAIGSSSAASLVPVGVVIPFAAAAAPMGWLVCNGQNVSRATYAALFAAIGVLHGAGDGSSTFTLPDMRGRVAAGVDGGAGRLVAGLTGGMAAVTLGSGGGESSHAPTLAEDFNHTHTVSGGTGQESTDHVHYNNFTSSGRTAGHNHGLGSGGSIRSNNLTNANFLAQAGIAAGADSLAVETQEHYHYVTGNTAGINVVHTHALSGASAAAQGASNAAHNNVQPTLVLNYIISTGGA
jgi:microcystin-dependent protein